MEELDHYSPSQLLKPMAIWMFNYVYLNKQQRRAMKVGYNAAFGTAVHGGIQAMLTLGLDFDAAVEQAYLSFDFHDAPEGEAEEKRKKYRGLIANAVKQGVDLLSHFGGAEEERRVEVSLEGIDLPVMGYIDLCASDAFCEVKTKAPRMGAVKKDGTRGWTKAAIPAKPQFEHLCQVSIYQKATGLEPQLAYIAATGGIIFTPQNCEELQPEYLAYCLEEMRGRAMRRQNLMKVSNDPKVLAGLLDPDFQHPFYWDDEFKEEARELWKV